MDPNVRSSACYAVARWVVPVDVVADVLHVSPSPPRAFGWSPRFVVIGLFTGKRRSFGRVTAIAPSLMDARTSGTNFRRSQNPMQPEVEVESESQPLGFFGMKGDG